MTRHLGQYLSVPLLVSFLMLFFLVSLTIESLSAVFITRMGISTFVGECPFPLPPNDNVAYCYSLYRKEWAELQLSQQHALVIRMGSTSSSALASAQ